jgi:hypothetical protein
MDRSSPRNNFLDILHDANAIAILISLGLHAAIGVYILPLLSQLPQPEKKAETNTVKVVQLTPSESQRIPQAPKPIATPTPPQQVLPPVYRPTIPVPPATPQISTAPKTIPISPVRTPSPGKSNTPPTGKKSQQVIRQPQPPTPSFDPDNTFNPPIAQPNPKPSTPPNRQNISKATPQPPVKPIEKPIEPVKPTPAAIKPQSLPPTDNDGEDNPPPDLPDPEPETAKTATQPPSTSQSSGSPNSTPTAQTPSSQSSSNLGNGQGNSLYGKYTQAANDRLAKYIIENPGIKPYSPKVLSRQYPPGAPCSNVKQPPFIVLMVAFGKLPDNPESAQENNVLGTMTAPSIDRPYVAADNDTPANRKLSALAADTALTEANTADKNRPDADKGKPVLYQYRVQFDPASCKN